MAQCEAMTKSGTRCKNKVQKTGEAVSGNFCYVHQPAVVPETEVLAEKNIEYEVEETEKLEAGDLWHWFLEYKKFAIPGVILLFLLLFLTGMAEGIGAVLTLAGLVWFIARIRQRRSRNETVTEEDFEAEVSRWEEDRRDISLAAPVWTLMLGGFFMLSINLEGTGFLNFLYLFMENIVFLAFFGYLLLFFSEFFLKGNAKKYRTPLIIFFLLTMFVAGPGAEAALMAGT